MSDETFSFAPPRGMRDFYPDDMVLRQRIFDVWRRTSERFGFAPYDACVVESLDLLKRKAGEEIMHQIYDFKDKSGRDLALRAEMTPTLARMVTARQGSLQFPLRWYTIAQCFRYERMTRGRKREHYQWNIDIIGDASVAAETEVVAAAIHAMESLGLRGGRDFFVHFSSRALLSELLSGLGVPPEHQPATFLALDKRGKIPDEEIRALLKNEGLAETTIEQVFRLLAVTSIETAFGLLPERTPAGRSVLRFLDLIRAYGLQDALRFDLSVIRGLAYYTGIVFEAFDAGRSLRALFGGGRYDDLMAALGGRPATGVGLGFGDVVVGELLAERGLLSAPAPATGVAVGFLGPEQHQTALLIAKTLRDRGQNVEVGLGPEKARRFFSRVGAAAHAQAIFIGPDDVAAGTVRVKNLADRSEQEMRIADLTASRPA